MFTAVMYLTSDPFQTAPEERLCVSYVFEFAYTFGQQ